jgi:membrane-bound metal-dependent hydrolase YbcI (DUF457 family)
MGHTHTLTGMAAWLTAGPVVLGATRGAAGLVSVDLPAPTGVSFALGVVACGGAAMLPDIDHEDSTIPRTYWPIGPAVSRLVNIAAGGHREGTHSLLFAGLTGSAAALALISPVAVAVLLGGFVGLAVAGLATGLFWRQWLHGAALPVTGLASLAVWRLLDNGTLHTGQFWWLPIAVAVGCLIHIAGDWCTRYGVPWLWPWRRDRFELDLFTTQSPVEKGPLTVGLTVLVFALIGWRVGVWSMVLDHGAQAAAR